MQSPRVVGSWSECVRALAAAGRVDEYRLITFPTMVGAGERLFADPVDLDLVSIEPVGATTYAVYVPAASSASA